MVHAVGVAQYERVFQLAPENSWRQKVREKTSKVATWC